MSADFAAVQRFERVRAMKTADTDVRSAMLMAEVEERVSGWTPTLPGFRNSLLGVEADPEHWKRLDIAAAAIEWSLWAECDIVSDCVLGGRV